MLESFIEFIKQNPTDESGRKFSVRGGRITVTEAGEQTVYFIKRIQTQTCLYIMTQNVIVPFSSGNQNDIANILLCSADFEELAIKFCAKNDYPVSESYRDVCEVEAKLIELQEIINQGL